MEASISLSELAPIIYNIELAHLGSEASIYQYHLKYYLYKHKIVYRKQNIHGFNK